MTALTRSSLETLIHSLKRVDDCGSQAPLDIGWPFQALAFLGHLAFVICHSSFTFSSLFAIGVILVSQFASKVDLDQECVLYGEIAHTSLEAPAFAGEPRVAEENSLTEIRRRDA